MEQPEALQGEALARLSARPEERAAWHAAAVPPVVVERPSAALHAEAAVPLDVRRPEAAAHAEEARHEAAGLRAVVAQRAGALDVRAEQPSAAGLLALPFSPRGFRSARPVRL